MNFKNEKKINIYTYEILVCDKLFTNFACKRFVFK